jgi:hypothetical protein
MTELEYLKGKLADTENEIEREEKKVALREFANYFHDMYEAFKEAGFNDEQAWFLTGTAFSNKVK